MMALRQPDFQSPEYRVPNATPHPPRNGSRGRGAHKVGWSGAWLGGGRDFCSPVDKLCSARNQPQLSVGCELVGRGRQASPVLTFCPCASSHSPHKDSTVTVELESPGAESLRAHALSTSMTGHCCSCYYYCQRPPQMHIAECCSGGRSRGAGGGAWLLSVVGGPSGLGTPHPSGRRATCVQCDILQWPGPRLGALTRGGEPGADDLNTQSLCLLVCEMGA